MTKFLQLLFQGMSLGAIYALIALGFVIVFKGSGVFNFAHGDFVMAGAYVVVVAAASAPYGLAVALALLVLVLLALVVERTVLRPMLGQPLFAVIMVTLGVSIMVRSVVAMLWGVEERGSSAEPIGRGVVHAGEVALPWVGIWTIGVSVLLLAALWFFFQKTGYGLALRATANSQEAALAQGIDIRRMFALSWAIAGVLAVAAGIFLGAFPRQVTPAMGATALAALPAIIIGGFDSVPGAVVGGLSVGMIQVLGAGYLADVGGGNFHEVLPYLVMLLVLAVRPYGLFGSPDIERV
ncbi:MAG: branched-chain amino acid ABC transporter permease [Acidimicrobiia bacterium]|nr:branched-chain amino acid ABC transporter permease [Acidimicrobiia bacterium]